MKVNPQSWRENKSGIFLRREITPSCPSGDMQIDGNKLIMKIAKKTGMPLLLTLDSHFVHKEQKIIQDLALQNGKDEGVGLKFSTSYHMLSTEEAWANWAAIHGEDRESVLAFEEAVDNNLQLIEMCNPIKFDTEFHLPDIKIPHEILLKSNSKDDALRQYTMSLIERYGRLPNDKRYTDRLEAELEVVCNNNKINLLPYFITLHDVCVVARSIGVAVGIGRGSAGGSLLAYLLNVTHKDPILYDMSFERFLSQGRINRGKFPDIDMDFSEPDRLAAALKDIYTDKIVRVCTTGTNKVKSAIKDVARVCLGTKDDKAMKDYIEELCKTIALVPQGIADLNKWLDGYDDPESGHIQGELERNEALNLFFTQRPEVANLVRSILGVPKSIGRHAAAYCIADQPIHQLVPICIVKGEVCTQFTMGPIEKLGLIKFDMLGLNTLKDISNCVRLIKQRHGIDLDIYNLPENDESVYADFKKGKTETVFQFNGTVPTSVCKLVKPNNIQDLAAITAACRPGTMYAETEDNGKKTTLINLWIHRRNNKRPVTYIHPSLQSILSSTHGIFLFQEQINKMFVECCGYSPEKADELREMIGKKQKDKMNEIIPDIRNRLKNNGWSKAQIDAIISLCQSAASYSFNKCLDLDTVVEVRGTKKKIKDVVAGDSVLALNELTGETHNVEVIAVHDSVAEVYEIELDGGSKITCSMNHKFLCKDGLKHPLSEILEKELEVALI